MHSDVEECAVDSWFANNTSLHVVQALQVVMSIISFVTMACTVLNLRERSLVHVNFRELFLLLYFFFLLHSISVGVLQVLFALLGLLLFRYYTIKDACDVGINKLLCYSLRITGCVCIMSFAFVYMAMALERTIATFYRGRYENLGPTIGRTLSAIVILSSIALSYLVFGGEDYTGTVAYCSGVTPSTARALTTGYVVLFGFDIVTFGLLIFLHQYNKRELQKKSEYELSRIFQLQVNVYVISMFWPNLLFHCVSYCAYLLLNLGLQKTVPRNEILTLQFYTALFYVRQKDVSEVFELVPYYTAISPLILACIYRRANDRRKQRLSELVAPRSEARAVDEQEHYFKIYSRQWHARPTL